MLWSIATLSIARAVRVAKSLYGAICGLRTRLRHVGQNRPKLDFGPVELVVRQVFERGKVSSPLNRDA